MNEFTVGCKELASDFVFSTMPILFGVFVGFILGLLADRLHKWADND